MKNRLTIALLFISATCLSMANPLQFSEEKTFYKENKVNLPWKPKLKGAVKSMVEKTYDLKIGKDGLLKKGFKSSVFQFYDGCGNKTQYRFYEDCEVKRNYTYDDNKKLTSEEDRTEEGKLLRKADYTYNEKGWIAAKTVQKHLSNGNYAKRTYQYKYNEKGVLRASIVSYYNKQGQVFSKETNVYNKKKKPEKRNFKCYDKKGRIISEMASDSTTHITYFYNTDGSLWYKDVMTFDKKQNKTAMLRYSSEDKLINGHTFTYKYDAKGNWIEKTTFCQGTPESLSMRKFEYYK